jgi:hypothetical protein
MQFTTGGKLEGARRTLSLQMQRDDNALTSISMANNLINIHEEQKLTVRERKNNFICLALFRLVKMHGILDGWL